MPKSSDIRLCSVSAQVESIAYRTPIKFGGRVVRDALIFNVRAEVETRGGARAVGLGSMPLGNVWAWPSAQVTPEQSQQAMLDLSHALTADADAYRELGDPLQLTHALAARHGDLTADVVRKLGLSEPMPRLAQLVSASPIEAAIHDAFGRAQGQNSYNVLGPEFINHDLGHYLNADFAGEYLDRYTLREPKPRMPLYHLVGALDPLTEADVEQRLDDGLPQTLGEWIAFNGLTHLKIKLNGENLEWDVARVAGVEQAAAPAQAARGCGAWHYSLDFNEKCSGVEYVLDFLARLQEQSPAAFERVHYIEQPTHRDLRAHREMRMHRAAAIKPVVIDESLVDFESLLLCREMGYSGVALKACKGQTEALLMGAAAQKFGMFLCVQDLTCPGLSFLHSASLTARIPTVAAIEGNSRQYCPAGNAPFADKFPGMFKITDGSVRTAELNQQGLGYTDSLL